MEAEPRNLNIPLYRRDWNGLWFVLGSAACAWLWHKPTQLPAITISCVVGGLAFWLALGPGLNRFKYHDSFIVRWATFVALIVGVPFVMRWLVPLLHSYVVSNP
ncbi:hypothetical protein C1H71_17960 [Iodobacter fluviatilis]|uniref:Uncharacterized protein n=1 Tax=Iodobacter fluviatilis TaxID=537 RepID=A0A7G3GE17_9NEIS|nr:hypothetical protein C1H71_17960 [Iodobacter fluviatilis]